MILHELFDERGDPCYLVHLGQRVHVQVDTRATMLPGVVTRTPGIHMGIISFGENFCGVFNRPLDDPMGVHRGMVLYGTYRTGRPLTENQMIDRVAAKLLPTLLANQELCEDGSNGSMAYLHVPYTTPEGEQKQLSLAWSVQEITETQTVSALL